MPVNASLNDYVERYFVRLEELARLADVGTAKVEALITARAIPGPVYALWDNGAYWSPIGGHNGPAPVGTAIHWYSPAAVWWVRRGTGMEPARAAQVFAEDFVADFVAQLANEQQGRLGYPHAYGDAGLDPANAALAGEAEWRDWLSGAYGVCLRFANARHAITKTCRRAEILEITNEGTAVKLTDAQRSSLLTALEDLDAVMLPFAPHQRPYGTPGLWLDTILARYGMGSTRDTTVAARNGQRPA